jgi:O-antigen/teichoic acid export membrane protein
MAANLCSLALIARALPQTDFGIYVLVTGLVLLLAQIADFGTGPVFGQHVGSLDAAPQGAAAGGRMLPGKIWGSFLLIRLVLAGCATGLGCAVALTFTGPARGAMILASLSVGFVAGRFLDPLYQVAGHAWRSAATQLAGAVSLIAFAALVWALHPTLPAFLWGFIVANAIYVAASWLAARDLIAGPVRVEMKSVWRMAALAAPMGVSGLLTAVNGRANLLFLAHDGGPASVATYGAATRVLDLAVNFAVVILWPLIPILSRSAQAGQATLAAELRRQTRLLLRLMLPLLVATPAVSPLLVRALYGPQYAGSGPVLVMLALVGAGVVFSLLASYTLLAVRITKYSIPITGISVVVNLTLNAILVPRYGPMGAAGAAVVCEAVLVGLVWTALARHLPGALSSGVLPMVAAASVIWCVLHFALHDSWAWTMAGALMLAGWGAAGHVRDRLQRHRAADQQPTPA